MKAVENLPEGYREIYYIDLQKNKIMAIIVNGLALVIAVLLAGLMDFIVPFDTMVNVEDEVRTVLIKFGVLIGSIIIYMVLHELVHGIAMKICGTKKVKYGFTGMYAFAGSEDFYDKKAYIFIALAPVVFWGIVLAVVNLIVPIDWFWIIYLIQIVNLSGAAGDLFVSVKFSRMPKDILIEDYGVGMTVYSKQ